MGDEASTVRLVRCPKCENLLPELPEYSVYQCGGCGAVLRGKQTTPLSEKRPLENSDNESGIRVSEKRENVSLKSGSHSQIRRGSVDFDLDRKKGRTVPGKVSSLSVSSSSRSEKREGFTESDQSRRRRLDFGKSKVNLFNDNYEQKRQNRGMNIPSYDNFGASTEFQEIRHPFDSVRSTPVGFHRNTSVVEKGRFGNLPYLNEGPSSSHFGASNSFGEHVRVKDLENDRAELLKKLDELKAQLSRSCNVDEIPNRGLNGLHNDPTFGNFPTEFRRYEEVYHPPPLQMSRQPPRHQYPPVTYHDRFRGYNQEPVFSHPHDIFCSCSQCYNMNWNHGPQKVRPFPSFDSRAPITYGPPQLPHHHLERSWMRTSGDIDLGNHNFARKPPRRRVMLINRGDECVSRPVSGGAPFVSCRNCFELLKIPRKLMLSEKNSHKKMKCGRCSASISLTFQDKKLVSSVSSPVGRGKVNETRSNESTHSSRDYDKAGYNFQFTSLSADEQRHYAVTDKSSSPLPNSESNDVSDTQNYVSTESQSPDQEKVVVDQSVNKQKSLKDATEMDVSLTEYLNCDDVNRVEVTKEDDGMKTKGGNESFFAGLIKKRFKDFSRSSTGVMKGKSTVSVNGHLLTDRVVKRAEKLAGPIQPGEYWYDHLAGFWGVMNQPCLGIIPPFIEEFDYPMPEKCAAGNTNVFVNGRELNQKDLDLLAGRGLPTTKDKSYIIDISGKVVDEDTGEELDCLGKLAPTVERVKHGFGMKVPQAGSK